MKTKLCSVCEKRKSVKEFTRDKSIASGYYGACKSCKRARDKERHDANREARNALYRQRQRNVNAQISNLKRECGCKICFEKEPVCLGFHHLDPSQKDFSIAARPNMNWEKILKEIEKCVVLCNNCHAKVHAGILKV